MSAVPVLTVIGEYIVFNENGAIRAILGTWESNNAACETDALCDPAVLVSTTAATANSEPHIRNRRLSPGSGNGGGGGGCIAAAGVEKHQLQTRRISPEVDHHAQHTSHAFAFRGEKEQRRAAGGQHKGRGGPRREAQKGPSASAGPGAGGAARAPTAANDRPSQKLHPKERWVGDGLSLLKPPPAFPVQDSPAKLQPAVSYASKVKSGAAGLGSSGGALDSEEDPPAIGVLLQNQWGLSFISEARPPAAEGSQGATEPCPAASTASASAVVTPTDETESTGPPAPLAPQQGTCSAAAAQPAAAAAEEVVPAVPAAPSSSSPPPLSAVALLGPCPEVDENNGKLLLSCRHLVEALKYHTREWNAVCNKQKDPKNKVVWYKDPLEQPA